MCCWVVVKGCESIGRCISMETRMGPKMPIEYWLQWPMQPDACSMRFPAGSTMSLDGDLPQSNVCPQRTEHAYAKLHHVT